MSKARQEIINYLKRNEKNSFIFSASIKGIEEYNIPFETMMKHIIIYQNNLITSQKLMLERLYGKT